VRSTGPISTRSMPTPITAMAPVPGDAGAATVAVVCGTSTGKKPPPLLSLCGSLLSSLFSVLCALFWPSVFYEREEKKRHCAHTGAVLKVEVATAAPWALTPIAEMAEGTGSQAYTQLHTHTHTHTHTYTHTHIRTHTYTHTHTHKNTHTHTHTKTHKNTHHNHTHLKVSTLRCFPDAFVAGFENGTCLILAAGGFAFTHTHTHTHRHTQTQTTHTLTHTQIHSCTHLHIYIRIYTHAHAYRCTHTESNARISTHAQSLHGARKRRACLLSCTWSLQSAVRVRVYARV
jgi:hypothetical protein